MNTTSVRLRRLLADNLAVAVLVVLLLIVFGAAVTYGAYGGDQTQTESRETTLYETTPSFTHGVTVQRENEVFPVGTRLEGRSQYYTRIAPVADGNYTLGYRAESGRLDAEMSTALVIRGVAGDSGEVLWEQRRRLDTARATDLGPGDRVRVAYRVNVSDLTDRATAITQSLGTSTGEVQTFLQVRSQLDGQVAGTVVERDLTDRLAISATSGTFSLTPNATSTAGRVDRVVTVETTPGRLRSVGGPLLLIAGLFCAGLLAVGRQRGWLSIATTERTWLTYRSHRNEFDEWITTGRVPDAGAFDPDGAVSVDDLKGLVDVAIDTDARVIEDAKTGRFVVDGPRRTYYFDPPDPASESSSDAVESAIKPIE